MKKVPFFNYQKAFTDYEKQFLDITKNIINSGAFIMQGELAQFEKNIADYLGVKHVIGLANCTDALHIAVRAAGIGYGDEVIVPSHTMVASPAAIHFAGATPVLVDCGEDHLIDPDSVISAITDKTKAIMPVQLNGRTANMDRICAIAEEHNLLIIEDSAQGLGSKYKGKFAGTFGIAGTFSFYPAKILGCPGDAGALVTNDDEIARLVKLYRDHGRDEHGEVVMWGLNSRLDNLQAAYLDVQFKDYDQIINRRREIATIYHENLSSINELKLPAPPDSEPDHFDVFQNYEIEAERRDDLKKYLADNGVGTLIQWSGKAVHQHEKLGFKDYNLPVTDRLFERCIMIPMNMTLSDEDVLYVCEVIKKFYNE